MPEEPFRPSAYQCSLLLLHLQRSACWKRYQLTQFKISELTLKRLCCRPRLDQAFLAEVQDWLLRSGWVLFYADRSFGVIKLEAVQSWTRLGSKRIKADLDAVAEGKFDFGALKELGDAGATPEDD